MRRQVLGAGAVLAVACACLSGCSPAVVSSPGAEEWALTFAAPVNVMTADRDTAIVASSAGQTLAAIDVSDGATIWSVPMAPMPSSADIRGDTVVIAQTINGDRLVGGLDLRTGEREWSRVVTSGSLVGAWADGRAVISDEDDLRVLDAANAVRAEWTPLAGCTLKQAVLAPGKSSWVAVRTDCDDTSNLTRLDANLDVEWTAAAVNAVNVTFHGDMVVLGEAGSDVTLVDPNGVEVLKTAGTELTGVSLLRRTFEDDVIDLESGGGVFTGVYPTAASLGPFAATNISLVSATGSELARWTQAGAAPQVTRVTEQSYLLSTFTSDTGFLTLIGVAADAGSPSPSPTATAPAPGATIRSAALGSVDLVSSGRTAATGGEELSIMESGELGRRLGTATVFMVADSSAAERILRLTSDEKATFDEAHLLLWAEHGVRSAGGSCLLNIVLDDATTPLDAQSALALSDSILDTAAMGACR